MNIFEYFFHSQYLSWVKHLKFRRSPYDQEQKGQGLAEYSLILVLVAVVLVLVVAIFGEGLADLYQFIVDELPF